MKGLLTAVFLAGSLLAGESFTLTPLDQAQTQFHRTHYHAVVDLLQPVAASDAAAAALLGRTFLLLGDCERSTEYLESAISLDPSRSDYYLWLGRTYGKRAESAFPLIAPHYATKARINFEKALSLNPNDPEITGDLFEYYLQAPAMLGGGFDKASKLADTIARRDPVEGAFSKARIAEARKDYATAELMLRRASELAPDQPGRLVDLAKFLAKRERYQESDAVFREARHFADGSPKVLFHEAATYIADNRKQNEARDLLKRYLAASTGPDEPSKHEAQRLLKKVSGT